MGLKAFNQGHEKLILVKVSIISAEKSGIHADAFVLSCMNYMYHFKKY